MAKSKPQLETESPATVFPEKASGKPGAQNGQTTRQSRPYRYSRALASSPLSIWDEDLSEVKRTLDGMRKRGVRDFRGFFENHPEQVLSLSAKVKVRWVNQATLRLFQARSLGELTRGLGKGFIKGSYDVFREELIALAEGRTEFTSEAVTLTLTGEKLHVMMNLSVQEGSEQTLSDVFVYLTDVSRLKHRESEIRESEEKYRRIFETSYFGVFVVDTGTGVVVKANAKAGELIGIPCNDIVGMHYTEIHPKEEAEKYRRLFRRHVTEYEFVSEDLRLKHKDGRQIPVEISSTVIDLPNQHLIAGIFRPLASDEWRAPGLAATDLRNALSDRENEIVRLIAWGLTNRQIAERLFISQKTVETHRSRIMKKLDAHKTADLVRHAMCEGLLVGGMVDQTRNA